MGTLLYFLFTRGAFLTDKDRPLSEKDKKRNREIMREETAREGVSELTLNGGDNLNIVWGREKDLLRQGQKKNPRKLNAVAVYTSS